MLSRLNCVGCGPPSSGGVSYGLSNHAHNSRSVNRFHRTSATTCDSDHPSRDLNCRYLSRRIAINAVQTCTRTALALVPTKVLIFKCCLSVLKKISICHRCR